MKAQKPYPRDVVDVAVGLLKSSRKSAYSIAAETGYSESSIGGWRRGVRLPSEFAARILYRYFTQQPDDIGEEILERLDKIIALLEARMGSDNAAEQP